MKVSFFTSLNDRGISTYSKYLLEEIEKDKDIQINLVGLEKVFRIKYSPLKYFYAKKLYKDLGVKMNEADIAHIQHDYSLFSLWTNPFENMYSTFRKQIKIPVILTVHEIVERNIVEGGSIKTRIKYGLKKQYYKIFSRYMNYIEEGMFEECAAVIVHTKKSKEILVSRGVGIDKIHIIEHGVSRPILSGNSVSDDKLYFGVENKLVLTTFGYISYRKGQDIVIDIVSKLPANVVYLIAGSTGTDPKYVEKLKLKVKELNLVDRVKLTGFVKEEDVKRLMNATDIILSPSRDITASGTISEAIAYHKMIIASNKDFIKEINEHIECIKTFSDESNLLEITKQFMNDSNLMKSFIENTWKYQDEFSYGNAAKKTIDLYKSITI